jgi:hypothetical protein
VAALLHVGHFVVCGFSPPPTEDEEIVNMERGIIPTLKVLVPVPSVAD